MPKDEPIIFTKKDREDTERIRSGTHELIKSLAEELKDSELAILFHVWSCTNANLRVTNRNHPEFEMQRLMNESNIEMSKTLDEHDRRKDA